MSEQATAIRIRVECIPHIPDTGFPIRLLIVDTDDTILTELKFTPTSAREASYSISRLLSHFIPLTDSRKLAEGLRAAAARVWATRN